jgi:hypothetical protein
VKTDLQDRLRARHRDRVAPDTGPVTGSISNQQPSTLRGEAHIFLAPTRRSAQLGLVDDLVEALDDCALDHGIDAVVTDGLTVDQLLVAERRK